MGSGGNCSWSSLSSANERDRQGLDAEIWNDLFWDSDDLHPHLFTVQRSTSADLVKPAGWSGRVALLHQALSNQNNLDVINHSENYFPAQVMYQRSADLHPDHLSHFRLAFGDHQPIDLRSVPV